MELRQLLKVSGITIANGGKTICDELGIKNMVNINAPNICLCPTCGGPLDEHGCCPKCKVCVIGEGK